MCEQRAGRGRDLPDRRRARGHDQHVLDEGSGLGELGGRRLLRGRSLRDHAGTATSGSLRTFGDFGGLLGPRVPDTNADPDGLTARDLFGGSQEEFEAHEPTALLTNPGPGVSGLGGWFEVGGDDAAPLAATQTLAPLAVRAGIATCVVIVPAGAHTFDVWSAALRSSLPWMAARLGLAPQTPELSACPTPT